MTFSIGLICDTQHKNALPLCLVSHFIYYHIECHCTECRYAECRSAEFNTLHLRIGPWPPVNIKLAGYKHPSLSVRSVSDEERVFLDFHLFGVIFSRYVVLLRQMG